MLSGNTVKYIQSLTHKKFRDKYQCFIAETPKVVEDLLSGGFRATHLLATAEWAPTRLDKFAGLIDQSDLVLEHELKKVSQLKIPRQVLGVFEIPTPRLPNVKGKVSLVLDDIQDPGNLGTIIRIADWFGIETIVCSEHTANVYNPKVVQATMGSIARVNVCYTGLADFFSANNVPVYATVLDGIPVADVGKIDEGFIVIGNEGSGISDPILSSANYKITIPRIGKAESLNAAIATGIILSHVVS